MQGGLALGGRRPDGRAAPGKMVFPRRTVAVRALREVFSEEAEETRLQSSPAGWAGVEKMCNEGQAAEEAGAALDGSAAGPEGIPENTPGCQGCFSIACSEESVPWDSELFFLLLLKKINIKLYSLLIIKHAHSCRKFN